MPFEGFVSGSGLGRTTCGQAILVINCLLSLAALRICSLSRVSDNVMTLRFFIAIVANVP